MMKMIGEKFLGKKIQGNKIIREFEFREFTYNYYEIAQECNDCLNDDPETQFSHGLCQDYDDFYSLDCDLVLEWIEEHIESLKDDDEEEQAKLWEKYIEPLKDASGFTIYLKRKKEDYDPRSDV